MVSLTNMNNVEY